MGDNLKKSLKLAFKILFTALALYLVYRKVDMEVLYGTLKKASIPFVVLGGLSLAVSKAVSSFRLNHYFKAIQLDLSEGFNLRLYWKGMFYNLFLPGGIGGDGYKVYFLHKRKGKELKPLGAAILLDRLTGLSILALLLLVLGMLVSDDMDIPYWKEVIYAGFVLHPIVSFIAVKLLFKTFMDRQLIGLAYSVVVQLLQLLGAYFILSGLSVFQGFWAYQFLFLVSSIVAVLPFTIGGAGARELTFTYGHDYLGVDLETAVAFSLLFFVVTSLSSLVGAFISVEDE